MLTFRNLGKMDVLLPETFHGHINTSSEVLSPECLVDSDSIVGKFAEFLDNLPAAPIQERDTCGYDLISDSPDGVKLFLVSGPSELDVINKVDKLVESGSTSSNVISTEHKFRTAILYRNISDIAAVKEKLNCCKVPPKKPSKLCFLVTCQGTHIAGMGRKLYETSPTFRKWFDHCDAIVENDYGFSVRPFLKDRAEDKPEWMDCPRNFLPYLLALQYALFKQFEEWGIKPSHVLGLSFGEYGAAAMAGIITIQEAFTLIMTRIELMMAHIPEEAFCIAMMDKERCDQIYKEAKDGLGMEQMWLDVAAINSPKQTCVVGHAKYIQRFEEVSKSYGIKTLLNAPYHPYHSRLTLPIHDKYRETTSTVKFMKSSESASPKLISTVDGKVHDTLNPDHFLEHLKLPGDFCSALNTAQKEGITDFVEIGPHPILIQLAKDILYKSVGSLDGYHFLPALKSKVDEGLCALNSLGRLYTAGYDGNWDQFAEVEG